MAGDDAYLLASAGNAAENQQMLSALPPGRWREVRRLPVGPRVATIAWQRLRLPLAVESLIGQFDVFHGTDFVVPPSRRPRVVTIHDLSFMIVPEYAEPNLVRYLLDAVPRAIDAAEIVITVSAAVAAEVAAEFPYAREKLVATPNGVRLPASLPERREPDRPELLTVGTIEPRKNLQTLLNAVAIVRESHPDTRLTIAGRVGWRSDEIMAAIRAAEAAGWVRFVEAPSDDALEALYQSATLAVYPSWYEGFGLPVVEAMARGVPVVASEIAALAETGGPAARYADPFRIESLAGAIVGLIEDADERSRLGQAGRERAATYSWQATAARTRRAYDLARGG
jgi:glycosyltransferase involved in cell wall biosynthesis